MSTCIVCMHYQIYNYLSTCPERDRWGRGEGGESHCPVLLQRNSLASMITICVYIKLQGFKVCFPQLTINLACHSITSPMHNSSFYQVLITAGWSEDLSSDVFYQTGAPWNNTVAQYELCPDEMRLCKWEFQYNRGESYTVAPDIISYDNFNSA